MIESIKYGSSTIYFDLTYSNRKTIGIKVNPDVSVEVISPHGANIDIIKKKVKSKASWITKQKDFFLSFHPITPSRKFISGETHLYLGRQYRLKLIESESQNVKLVSGNLQVFAKDIEDKANVEKLLKSWYSEKAEKVFNELFNKCVASSSVFAKETTVMKYRWMDKRWGSCGKNGDIILNTELIKANKRYIEYVIIHELCHLIHFNHSSDFYKLLEEQIPDWRKVKHQLEKLMV